MNPQPIPTQTHGLDLGDIYYVLFRHKWKIMMCSAAGILAAIAIYRFEVPPYQSEAKLLVRYIISENKPTGPSSNNASTKISPDERGQSIMNTEQEILKSADLAREVAAAIGPEKLLAKVGGGKEPAQATAMVRGGLYVNVATGSSVINLVFRHPDAELVPLILKEVIERYLKLHVETHRAVGMLGDSLAQEAEILRSRLNQTDDDLRKALSKSGITSLDSAKEEIGQRMIATRREISNYQAELAGRIAVFEDVRNRRPAAVNAPADKSAAEPEPEIPMAVFEEVKIASNRFNQLQAREQELLLLYLPESTRVKEARALRVEAEATLQKFREQYPALTKIKTIANNAPGGPDAEAAEAATAWLQITAYQAKIKELDSQLVKLKSDAAKLDLAEGNIQELRRKKEIEEANYRYYAANVEQARISQTLGNGKVSNITQIQSPSPAFRSQMNMKKVGISAAAGIIAGLLWAFLIELYLDRSIRRPTDLHKMLRVPLFLSIPRLKTSTMKKSLAASSGSLALTAGNGAHQLGDNPAGDTTDPSPARPLQLFHETLRDRLISYFESKNLTHKPKLVAVTGLSGSAGVTTTAAGLARSLSETGEGNVLLVDMTVGQGAAHQFIKGREACGLDELLEARTQAHVHENLYVVAESSNSERLSRSLPQRFSKLVPKLKASDFDYIIFDMPTVNQLSITPRLAGYMDMVLLVVESEKTDRDVLQGACALLAESKAHVGIVLNKTRNYVPTRLQQQLMAG